MSHPRLELLPAVDIAGGQAVQLVQGVAGTAQGYGDPLAAALAWQEQGAEWVHLVDLDAAFGGGSNREVINSVIGKLDIAVELSGGIRDSESLEVALATGCRSVCERTDRPVVASGGISTLRDLTAIRELVEIGVEGAIVGSALYQGAFRLSEALDVAGRPPL